MNDISYPKFQYSKFVDGKRNGQIVIRTDDQEEFEELKKYVDGLDVNEIDDAMDEFKAVNQGAPLCPIHGKAFVFHEAGISKTTGKPYPGFYACPEKNADGSYCREKPKK